MQHYRSMNPKTIHGTTNYKSVTVCGQRGRNVTADWNIVTCQRCVEAMEVRYGKDGFDFWKKGGAKSQPEVVEKKAGESICCDDPQCPDKDGKIKKQADCEAHSDAATCQHCEPPELEAWPCCTCGRSMVLGEVVNSTLDPAKGICPECKAQEAQNIAKWAADMHTSTDEYLHHRRIQQSYERAKSEYDKRRLATLKRFSEIRAQVAVLLEELGRVELVLAATEPSFAAIRDRLTPPLPPAPTIDLSAGLSNFKGLSLGSLISNEAARFKTKR